jgi:hypothetical protein
MKPLSLALLVLILCSGCSSFNREWRRTPASATDPLEGRWNGHWLSSSNGHKGALRCLISKLEGDTYQCRYRANYRWLLRFEYAVPVTVRREGDVYHFSGRADLGLLAGGIYSYEGSISGEVFRATYDSRYDKGIFEMSR